MASLDEVTTGERHRFTALLHIGTAAPFRAWLGEGDLELPGDDELDPGGIYPGIGTLTGLPAFRQLVGGEAEQITVSFSGVDAAAGSWVHDAGSDITGAVMSIGIVFFDAGWQIATPVFWIWCGTVDVPAISRNGMQKSVTLTVGSELIDRSRATYVMWNNPEHQAVHAGDLFFEYTALNSLFPVKWPA